jgi:prevent-host-death family protein
MTIYTGHMADRRMIAASDFKAKCLALLDEVAETRGTLVVTKRGKPVAQVVPVGEPRSLVGSVTYLLSDHDFVHFSLDWGEGDAELAGRDDRQ